MTHINERNDGAVFVVFYTHGRDHGEAFFWGLNHRCNCQNERQTWTPPHINKGFLRLVTRLSVDEGPFRCAKAKLLLTLTDSADANNSGENDVLGARGCSSVLRFKVNAIKKKKLSFFNHKFNGFNLAKCSSWAIRTRALEDRWKWVKVITFCL